MPFIIDGYVKAEGDLDLFVFHDSSSESASMWKSDKYRGEIKGVVTRPAILMCMSVPSTVKNTASDKITWVSDPDSPFYETSSPTIISEYLTSELKGFTIMPT